MKFLEKESQPRSATQQNTSTLLNIVQPVSNRSSPTQSSSEQPTSISAGSSKSSVNSQPIPVTPVQPILLTEGIMQNFAPPRNSSSILKDILNDS